MMDLDELLGIDNSDPVQRLANDLVQEDDRLLSELVELRRKTMTQQDVADRLGISRPAVAAFERYDADPKLSTIRRYALAVRAYVSHTVTPESQRREAIAERALERHWQATGGVKLVVGMRHGVGAKLLGIRYNAADFVTVIDDELNIAAGTDSPVQDRRYHGSVKRLVSSRR